MRLGSKPCSPRISACGTSSPAPRAPAAPTRPCATSRVTTSPRSPPTLPDLRAIAFNGGTALKYGRKQLGAAAERYQVVALPSSSPLHTVGFEAKRPAWDALAGWLD
jgi:hypothetical protein